MIEREIYPCPGDARRDELDLEPDDRTCGEEFLSIHGACSHAVFSGDDNHPQRSWPECRSDLEESNTDAEITDMASEPEIPPAEKPADMNDDEQTADCPNCGSDLGHSEEEVEAFIREHGAARCDQCDARITIDD